MRSPAIALPFTTVLLLTTLALLACADQHGRNNLPPGYEIQPYLDEITYPVALQFASDGRLFYIERHHGVTPPLTGRIRVVDADGTLQAQPFAEIAVPDDTPQKEKGLLGLALDPDFSTNNFVYVYRTARPDEGNPREHNDVLRYTAVRLGTDWIGTEMVQIVGDLPASADCCHNGGALGFGPDGKLYVTVGDVTEPSNGQNVATRAAAMLRFNRDGTIPLDNPFVGVPGVDASIYAFGLRNTFGFDWHPVSGELFGTDNGPNCNDELNRIVAGGNYGWAASHVDGACVNLSLPFIEPLFVWEDTIGVAGAEFYAGETLAEFQGDLFVSSWDGGTDPYENGVLFQVTMSKDGSIVAVVDLLHNCGQRDGDENMLDVETGTDGNLYFSCQDEMYPALPNTGTIYRIVSTRPPGPPAIDGGLVLAWLGGVITISLALSLLLRWRERQDTRVT